ncbi:class I SAM-dependent methyltransferase [Streptomyces sp. NRRL WC-3742]|uniref:class I SAM-dependent methyltransferase n=1 Tax=Streptomyces sp. NRRL WC-3742 TaxID=1463934 RepID=UPI00068D202C|nr:class I SAM-dependent methyltransferase [Streptomyces sp. NRRL WC-3742]
MRILWIREEPGPVPAGPRRIATAAAELEIAADGDRVLARLDGTVLERVRLDGRVSSLALGQDGLVTATTSVGTAYGLCLRLSAQAAAALLAAERQLPAPERAARAAELYLGAASTGFAVRRLRRLADAGAIEPGEADREITGAVRNDPPAGDPEAAFEAASAFARSGCFEEAVGHYQAAFAAEHLRARALHGMGDCFQALGAAAAADSVYRRAAACGPSEEQKQALYDLARGLGERGRTVEAARQLEFLLSWDADYQDAWAHLRKFRSGQPAQDADLTVPPTVSTVRRLAARDLLPSVDQRGIDAYDSSFYHQFDNTAVQDTVKKRLEMVQLLTAVDPTRIGSSLDIGSGTLRYPQVLAGYGVRSVGIDLRDSGVRACVEPEWLRRFVVADGTALPFRDGSFDLITCMMGTVNHLSDAQRLRLFAQARRTLRPGGRLVVSAWDPRCAFQSFLSFYSPMELAQLRGRLTEPSQLAEELRGSGFGEVATTPFCTFPDAQAVGVSVPDEDADTLAALVELDHLQTARDPERAGQLFLLTARA